LGVIIVNERGIEKAQKLQRDGYSIGSYHSFPALLSSAAKNQTPETPNVLGIYLLGCVCDDMLKVGIDTVQKEIADKADRLYRFFDEHPIYRPFVEHPPWRSSTINVIEAPEGCLPVIQKLEEAGFIVGSGYGEYKERHVRIANFPSQNRVDLERLLDILGNV
jgi:phosphoserine aminotransferase